MRRRITLVIVVLCCCVIAAAVALPFTGAATAAVVAPAARSVTATPSVESTAPSFESSRAIANARSIASFGPRRMGHAAEARAIRYVARRLAAYGYRVSTPLVRLPSGHWTRNVLAAKPGRSSKRIVIGAHIDTKAGSPGANDNASGVGAVIELARVLRDADTEATVVFAAFGGEERWATNPRGHHYGSKSFVSKLTPAGRANISAMVSLDMIGVGTRFHVRSMGRARPTAVHALRAVASSRGSTMTYLRDTARYGSSDHEPFELAGIPSAWVQWRADPYYHTRRDTASRLSPSRVAAAGGTVADWLTGMDAASLKALRP
ncbi:MAG: M28 family metallopeptidase [Coriobacteriia bacterium]|nr:M28 family metallopeptidase [Coriobacteriia bacterium]